MNPARAGLISTNVLKFSVSLALSLGLSFVLSEPAFSDSQDYVLFLLFFSIALWVTEAIPPFAVGLFIIAFLVFALGNPYFNSEPEDIAKYVNTFSSRVIWLMLGGFFLAEAMTKTKLDADLFRFALRISGTRPRSILLGLMGTSMLASMLMSSAACTAIVIAAVMPLLLHLGKGKPLTRALLVGIPLAASVGAMGTLIGTPPNLVAVSVLESAGIEVGFLEWMYYGVPLAALLTAISWLLLVVAFLKDNEPVSGDFLKRDATGPTRELRTQRVITVVVVIATVLMWMSSEWHNVSVSAVSAIPIVFLTMTGIIQGSDIRGLSWDTLLLVAGGMSLGVALQETGLLKHYAELIAVLSVSQLVFMAILAYAAMALSNVASNTATASVLVPLGMALVPGAQLEVALIIGLAASTSVLLPVSNIPTAIAYSTGLVDSKDVVLGGTVIGVLGPALIILWVLFVS